MITNPIGFSTGALSKGDFHRGLAVQRHRGLRAIELSALREGELIGLANELAHLETADFDYVSIHTPGRIREMSEEVLVERLRALPENYPLIVHPDIIVRWELWEQLGSRVCIENMDQRKVRGRTVEELWPIFERLPRARFCFDIGHASQIDPTMSVAASMLIEFGDKLTQVHLSEVCADSSHSHLTSLSQYQFASVAHLIPSYIPIIIESVISEDEIDRETDRAESIFESALAFVAN